MQKEITNLGLASYLSIIGYKLLGVKPNGRRSIFIFEATNGMESDCMDYFNRKASVEPVSFWESVKNLKALTEQN